MAEEQQEKKKKEGHVRKFFREFKEFLSKGNILDMAVGVIIGSAFGKIVTSLTNDILMPLITLAMGKNSIAELCVVLRAEEVNAAGEVVRKALTWNWGNFLQTIIDFILIAFVVFLILKVMIGLHKASKRVAEEAREFADKVKDKQDEEEKEAENAALEAQGEAEVNRTESSQTQTKKE